MTLDPNQQAPFSVSWTPNVTGAHTLKAEAYGRVSGVDHLDNTRTLVVQVV